MWLSPQSCALSLDSVNISAFRVALQLITDCKHSTFLLALRLQPQAKGDQKVLPKRRNILIIDSDLGSVFWLGQVLDTQGWESLPAKSLPDARLLLAELKIAIDLLIAPGSLPGVASFAETLRRSQGHLKMIGLLGDNEELSELELQMDAWLQKPFLTDETAKCHYLELIRGVLAETGMLTRNIASRHGEPLLAGLN